MDNDGSCGSKIVTKPYPATIDPIVEIDNDRSERSEVGDARVSEANGALPSDLLFSSSRDG
jgi:hypothetical protein